MRRLFIFVLFLPLALYFLGAASNQLVIVANHGKFPVMMNPVWVTNQAPDADGMIDAIHCVMTNDTHLNFLADVFNFHRGIESIGDLLIDAGSTLVPYCLGFGLCLICIPSSKVLGGSTPPTVHYSESAVPARGSDSTIRVCRAPTTSALCLVGSTRSDLPTTTRN